MLHQIISNADEEILPIIDRHLLRGALHHLHLLISQCQALLMRGLRLSNFALEIVVQGWRHVLGHTVEADTCREAHESG